MRLKLDEPARRRNTGILLGFLVSVPLFINSGSLIGFALSTVLGVLIVTTTFETSYRIWSNYRRYETSLKFVSSSLTAITLILALYLTVFFGWLIMDDGNCMMAGDKSVENRFTGQCRTIQVCTTTPWYYKEGCSSGTSNTAESCLQTVKAICAADKNNFETPSTCESHILPEKYRGTNGTVNCPS